MRASPFSPLLAIALACAGLACSGKDGGGAVDDTGGDDADNDGWPAGQDCDDADPTVHPENVERCDGKDNNCDGTADEGLTTLWFTDADNDGFGDDASGTEACLPSETHTTQLNGDCDDADPSVHPRGVEVCDFADNDCNGIVDDPSEFEVSPWYADADGDGYGDPADESLACARPPGRVGNDLDCDDSDAAVAPGAPEDGGAGTGVGDGQDNDCDGAIDEGLLFGTGIDGAGSFTDATFTDIGGACTKVLAVDGSLATVDDATAFAPGDAVLVISLQGRRSEFDQVGNTLLSEVAAVGAGEVTLVDEVTTAFGPDNTALAGHSVALIRVPQFTDFTLTGRLSADPFDGDCGGVVAFLATGTVEITGTIDARGVGYEGGDENTLFDSSGRAGYGIEGRGDKSTSSAQNGGGGGGATAAACSDCTGNGGGGGHGVTGTAGDADFHSGGTGGTTEGNDLMNRLFFGGGGGAGALDTAGERGIGGAGGSGGGVVFIRGRVLTVDGAVDANGTDGARGCGALNDYCARAATSEAGSGGGGAGGSIYLVANELSLGPATLSAVGGLGAESAAVSGNFGGDGGAGRIRLDFFTLNGFTVGSADATTAAANAATPDAGTLASP